MVPNKYADGLFLKRLEMILWYSREAKTKKINDKRQEGKRFGQGSCRCLSFVIFSQKNLSEKKANAGVCLARASPWLGQEGTKKNLSKTFNWRDLARFSVVKS